MSNSAVKKPFNTRAFVSISLFFALLWLVISGMQVGALDGAPATTQAAQFWKAIHHITGAIFALFAIIHIVKNWTVLKNHLKKVSRETVFGILVAVIIGVLGVIGSQF
ncbi:hypothetical protein AGMMS49938_02690 [Fibrobacterales bacterium]|nr:hypothetical protein AGMMS49938_02690 [Fibrobacterales bacterium]